MNPQIIALPVLSGAVGFCAGAIAIRMLFWPYQTLRIFRCSVPLMPGLIPREQKRIAAAIGGLVQDQFSRDGIVADALTAPEMQARIAATADELIQELKAEKRPLRDFLAGHAGSGRVAEAERMLKETVSGKITESIVAMNAGDLIAEAIGKKISEKAAQGGHGLGLGFGLLHFFGGARVMLAAKINDVVIAKAPAVVGEAIEREADRLLDAPIKDLAANYDAQIQNLRALMIRHYNDGMRAILDKAFAGIDLAAIVEREILKIAPRDLDVKFSGLFSREFRTVRWSGALLGMIAGLASALMTV